MNVVECVDLSKTIGGKRALDQLNLTINENKLIGLIGKNGAGKTTLMKMLAGFWSETSGVVKVFSERPFNNLHVSVNAIYVDDQTTFSRTLMLVEII